MARPLAILLLLAIPASLSMYSEYAEIDISSSRVHNPPLLSHFWATSLELVARGSIQ